MAYFESRRWATSNAVSTACASFADLSSPRAGGDDLDRAAGGRDVIMGLYSLPARTVLSRRCPSTGHDARVVRRIRPSIQGIEEGLGRFRSKQLDGIRGIATVKSLGAEDGLRAIAVEASKACRAQLLADYTLWSTRAGRHSCDLSDPHPVPVRGRPEVLAGKLSIGGYVSFNGWCCWRAARFRPCSPSGHLPGGRRPARAASPTSSRTAPSRARTTASCGPSARWRAGSRCAPSASITPGAHLADPQRRLDRHPGGNHRCDRRALRLGQVDARQMPGRPAR